MSWDPYADFQSVVLPNGLTVHTAHWPDRPWQAMGFLIHSGAEQDSVGLEGTAHFVEHLTSANAMVGQVELRRLFEEGGGWINLGETSYFSTMYRFFVPANKEKLAHAFSLTGHMLLDARLEKLIERERQVIVGEYKQSFPLEFRYDLLKHEHEVVYQGYWLERFARPLGDLGSIARITQSDLQSYYDAHYTPTNMSVVGVGGMELSQLVELLEKSPFGHTKEGARTPLPTPVAKFGPLSETRHVIEVSKYVSVPVASGSYRSVAKIPGTVKEQAVRILDIMLETILSEEVREKRAWTYDIDCSRYNFRHFYEFIISCPALATEALGDIESVIADCISKVGEREDLFEQTMQKVLARIHMTDETGAGVCRGALNDLSVFQWIVPLAGIEFALRQVTMDNVREALSYLQPERRWTFIMHP
ncbi:MAG: insulinase family protein [Candidatus Pacebacteria bacterium]|nr:insulinase family protein [Candidatus Paceibacterota bacterium]